MPASLRLSRAAVEHTEATDGRERLPGRSAGILPSSRAHPAVESAIARSLGAGGAPYGRVRESVGAMLDDPLDDVTVHNDVLSHELAAAVSARAFTVGRDIYMGAGEHRPGTDDGDRLLAHELAHAVQQRAAATSGPLEISQPGDGLEREADAVAGDALR